MGRMRKFFTKNMLLKSVALCFALALQSYLYGKDNFSTASLSYFVNVRGVAEGYKIVSPKSLQDGMSIRVRVKGPAPILQMLAAEEHQIQVKAPESVPSVNKIVFSESMLGLPPTVSLIDVSPSSFILSIDSVKSGLAQVQVPVAGRPADGYFVAELAVTPEEVSVTGSAAEVSATQSVTLEPVAVDGKTESFEAIKKIILPTSDVELHPLSAKVKVVISKSN